MMMSEGRRGVDNRYEFFDGKLTSIHSQSLAMSSAIRKPICVSVANHARFHRVCVA